MKTHKDQIWLTQEEAVKVANALALTGDSSTVELHERFVQLGETIEFHEQMVAQEALTRAREAQDEADDLTFEWGDMPGVQPIVVDDDGEPV